MSPEAKTNEHSVMASWLSSRGSNVIFSKNLLSWSPISWLRLRRHLHKLLWYPWLCPQSCRPHTALLLPAQPAQGHPPVIGKLQEGVNPGLLLEDAWLVWEVNPVVILEELWLAGCLPSPMELSMFAEERNWSRRKIKSVRVIFYMTAYPSTKIDKVINDNGRGLRELGCKS